MLQITDRPLPRSDQHAIETFYSHSSFWVYKCKLYHLARLSLIISNSVVEQLSNIRFAESFLIVSRAHPRHVVLQTFTQLSSPISRWRNSLVELRLNESRLPSGLPSNPISRKSFVLVLRLFQISMVIVSAISVEFMMRLQGLHHNDKFLRIYCYFRYNVTVQCVASGIVSNLIVPLLFHETDLPKVLFRVYSARN